MGRAAAQGGAKPNTKVVPKTLFQKGRTDKAVIQKATSMTKEEWQKHQVGMNEKWPLPEYMNGEKGSMSFKDETFAIVTRWTAGTKIQYRPHAKAPGSKSHIRYEAYSKAKTVGEALKCGTYPADWCWDFERGFIKVVGGHIREEPLDTNEIKEGGDKVTAVDKAIHTWYKRELAKQLGISLKELVENIPMGESLSVRGQRLLAQKDAKERLEAADRERRSITDEELLLTLKRWAFLKNVTRQNVMKEDQQWVHSDTLGVLKDRIGDCHLTPPTRRYAQVAELFARWLTDRLPKEVSDFKFTSMNVNCNYAAQLHRDQGNFGPSFIRAFGDFTGGELNYWPEDTGGKLHALPKAKKVQFDLSKDLALFNGNCGHSVEEFSGLRYSIVFFTVGCHAQIQADDKAKLRQLGIPCPQSDEDPYRLLRAPRGYDGAGGLTPSKKALKEPPAWRSWRSAELGLGKKSPRKGSLKRVEPENERSFYGASRRKQGKGE
uniref:Uncharacterized protein n=1 Tax=Zooxanthella nutricula TaxID=1333877 RepID=A0A6U9JCA6_9DINO|mmetsp:Transcript_92804/g.284091  ORF Transcript_92804/g.284091 Transcript_92804/m.284091 type:complete len:491 (+) Transcript_92804:100-1572(+)